MKLMLKFQVGVLLVLILFINQCFSVNPDDYRQYRILNV